MIPLTEWYFIHYGYMFAGGIACLSLRENRMAADLVPEAHLLVSDAEIENRKTSVGLEEADIARIRRLKPVVEPHAAELADAFFDYLAKIDKGSLLFRRRELLNQAKQLKRDHIVAMVQGEYGRHYVDERIRLAVVYAQTQLENDRFLGAFQHLIALIGKSVMAAAKGPVGGTFEQLQSLQKLAFFDLGLIVKTLVAERERTIVQQQESIRELSTPVLQLRDRLLILPIIGLIDSFRAKQLTDGLLHAIRANRAKVVVIDITGVGTVDSKVANHLIQTVAAARLMGARAIVTGLSAEVAQTLVTLGVDLGSLRTVGDLQGGLEEAELLLGYKLVPIKETEAAE
jgi:rsbT co-antagonist protein RsbR